MMKELFDALSEQAIQAKQLTIYTPKAEPDHRYIVHDPAAGKTEWRDADPVPRNHTALSLATLCKFVGQPNVATRIWYSRKGIFAIIDDNTRRDRVTMPLTFTKQFQALAYWEGTNVAHKQAALIWTLRSTFANNLPLSADFLPFIRSLRWTGGSDAQINLEHGKASIGKEIRGAVLGVGDAKIPEQITFSIAVFDQFAGMHSVQCAVDVELGEEKIRIVPLVGELEKATKDAESYICAELDALLGDQASVLCYGSP